MVGDYRPKTIKGVKRNENRRFKGTGINRGTD